MKHLDHILWLERESIFFLCKLCFYLLFINAFELFGPLLKSKLIAFYFSLFEKRIVCKKFLMVNLSFFIFPKLTSTEIFILSKMIIYKLFGEFFQFRRLLILQMLDIVMIIPYFFREGFLLINLPFLNRFIIFFFISIRSLKFACYFMRKLIDLFFY